MPPRKSFLLRIDPDLWSEVEAWAQQELRSVNGQIEFILRQAVLKRRGSPAPPASVDPSPETPVSPPSSSGPSSDVKDDAAGEGSLLEEDDFDVGEND